MATIDEGEFDLILPDCPWPETGGGGRGTAKHYRTVPWDEMPALLLGSPYWRPARSFWLGLWATKTSLPYAMSLLTAAGTRYVTTWTWIKTTGQQLIHRGMGQYGAHGVEFILWGKRGTVGRLKTADKEMADFDAPVSPTHSEKPAIAYQKALRVFAHTRPLEMFARTEREGWESCGDGVGRGW